MKDWAGRVGYCLTKQPRSQAGGGRTSGRGSSTINSSSTTEKARHDGGAGPSKTCQYSSHPHFNTYLHLMKQQRKVDTGLSFKPASEIRSWFKTHLGERFRDEDWEVTPGAPGPPKSSGRKNVSCM